MNRSFSKPALNQSSGEGADPGPSSDSKTTAGENQLAAVHQPPVADVCPIVDLQALSSPRAHLHEPQFLKLDNGAELSAIVMPDAAQVALGAFIYCPVESEREGEQGIRHFCEHMFAGGNSELKDFWAIMGRFVELDTFPAFRTGPEGITMSIAVEKSRYEEALDLMSSMLLRSTFHPANIEYQAAHIESEFNGRRGLDVVLNSIVADRSTTLKQRLELGMEGHRASEFSRDQLANFIDREMSVSSLKLLVVGDLKPDVHQSFNRHFGQTGSFTDVLREAPLEPAAEMEVDFLDRYFLTQAIKAHIEERGGPAPLQFGQHVVGAAFPASIQPQVAPECLRLIETVFREHVLKGLEDEGIIDSAHVSSSLSENEVLTVVIMYTPEGGEQRAYAEMVGAIAETADFLSTQDVEGCKAMRSSNLLQQLEKPEAVCERQLSRLTEVVDEGTLHQSLNALRPVNPEQILLLFRQVFDLSKMNATITAWPDQR